MSIFAIEQIKIQLFLLLGKLWKQVSGGTHLLFAEDNNTIAKNKTLRCQRDVQLTFQDTIRCKENGREFPPAHFLAANGSVMTI